MRASTGKFSRTTLVGCIAVQMCIGVLDLWSVFKTTAMDYYGWTDGSTNMVASILLFCFCVGNLAGGVLQDRTNPRLSAQTGITLFAGGFLLASFIPAGGSIILFYITYCVLTGMGVGFVYSGILNCLQRWWPHRRGLATGTASSAFGLSTVLLSPICSALLDVMSMPQAMRVLAGVLFVVGMVACLFISLPDQAYLDSLNLPAAVVKEGMTTAQAVRTVPFWCLFFSTMFFNATWTMLSPLIKGLGMERGLSAGMAVLTVSLTGLTNAAGRLLMAVWSDRIGRIMALNILCGINLLCALCLIFAGGPFYLVIVLLAAFAYGGPASVNPALCTDLFGIKHAGGNYGVAMLSLGFASVIFNAISNALYAATGTYTMTFLMGGVTVLLAVVMVFLIQRFRKQALSESIK